MKNFYSFKQKSRNNEFAQMYGHMHGIVNNYNAEELKIAGAVEKLTAALPLLEELKVRSRQQPLTQEQKSLVSKIDKGISALSGYIGVKLRHSDEPEAYAVALYRFIQTSLKGYSRKNTYGRMSTVNKMLQSLASDSSFSAISDQDECGSIISKLNESYGNFDALYQKRRKAISDKESSRTETTKRKLYYVLRELLATIDIAAVANPETDYKPLINELNIEIMRFNAGSKPKVRKNNHPESEISSNAPELEDAV